MVLLVPSETRARSAHGIDRVVPGPTFMIQPFDAAPAEDNGTLSGARMPVR
jgi:hypothetical protein